MIKQILASLQKQITDRRAYNRALAEIDALSARELADLRADPIDMRRQVYQAIYGGQRA